MINLNGKLIIVEKSILKFRSDVMGNKFLPICLISIVSVMVMYILALCDSYNFLSYVLGMMVGGFSAILGCSLND